MHVNERSIEYTQRFYEWERRGRGRDLYEAPVHPEPPFAWPNLYAQHAQIADDTRQETMVSRLFSKKRSEPTGATIPEQDEQQAEAFFWPEELVEHTLLLPRDTELYTEATAAWLSSLQTLSAPVVYELIARGGQVEQRVSCLPKDAAVLRASVSTVVPMAQMEEAAESVIEVWRGIPDRTPVIVEFGLGREFMMPLATGALRPSALASFATGLSGLSESELGILQVIFTPTRAPWAEAIAAATTTPSGQPFFADAPEVTKYAAEKISAPLFAAALKLAVWAEDSERAFSVIRSVAAGLGRLSTGNELIPLGTSETEELAVDVLLRTSHRTGMILSLPELAQLVSLPGRSEETPTLLRLTSGKAAPARLFGGEGVALGTNPSSRKSELICLPTDERLRHVHVVGATGTGKSTLLTRIILEDIEAGRGVAVLDPHGDLVDEVLGRLPESRTSDCIVFDPSDPTTVVGWNMLSATSEPERQMLASDLVAVFKRLATSWGDQMTSVLANVILSFLDSSRGGTLLELRRFLTDKAFRDEFITTIRDPYLASYWSTEFPLLVGRRPQAPILTRLDTLLRSKLVREVVTAQEKHIDFRAVMDEGQIFLARLSQGAIGRENAALLGSLLVSKFQQAALTRQDVAEEKRKPFMLYLDEVQEIATPSLSDMLSGIRKYGVGVTASHQSLHQLRVGAPEVERALLDNAHTRIYFRLGDDDARRLAGGFSSFTAEDLMALRRGEAICRVESATADFDLRTERLLELDTEAKETRRANVIEESRARWGVPRPKATREPISPPQQKPAPPQEPAPSQVSDPAKIIPREDRLVDERQPTRKESTTEGVGGPEHQYLQSLIREWGQQRGYKVDLEYELEAGGRVDLVLTRDEERHAVEVSVSTSSGHEIENVRKCLDAGFENVFVVSLKRKFLTTIAKRLDELLSVEERGRVQIVTPEDLLAQLSEEPIAQQTVAGYTVRTSVKTAADTQAQERRQRLSAVIAKSVRRLNKESI